MIDYQWPHPEVGSMMFSFDGKESGKNISLYKRIETFFSELFNVEVILMPSGRAAISTLIKHLNTNRSHTIFAPKWTSHCVWDMVTRLANPTIDCSINCNTIIAVHKWGSIERLKNKYTANIIEDSVDSIFVENSTFFPNNGEYEIVSLPKVIGSYSGGLILVKNKLKADLLRTYLVENMELGIHQSELRYRYALNNMKQGFDNWEDRENENTTLDTNALIHIEKCLKNYGFNKEIISRRLEVLSKLDLLPGTPDRLPPVFCVEIKNDIAGIDPKIMIRNKNISGFLDEPEFRKVGLIPLHFRADNELFEFCLKSLCPN